MTHATAIDLLEAAQPPRRYNGYRDAVDYVNSNIGKNNPIDERTAKGAVKELVDAGWTLRGVGPGRWHPPDEYLPMMDMSHPEHGDFATSIQVAVQLEEAIGTGTLEKRLRHACWIEGKFKEYLGV